MRGSERIVPRLVAGARRAAGPRTVCVLLTAVFALGTATAPAGMLGRFGPVYAIKEESILQWIHARLIAMEQSGELGRLQREYARRNIALVQNPRPVAGVTPTVNPRSTLMDPGIRTEQTITDGAGRIIAPAGTYLNPLDVYSMPGKLYFFDGRIKAQRHAARRFYAAEKIKPTLVLIAGRPFQLMARWQMRLYYDQNGVLTRRFGIEHVPAIVAQDGRMLRVSEVRAP